MMPHPSTSRKWWQQSQLSIILTFLWINQSLNWLSMQVGVLLMVCMFSLGWSVPSVLCKLPSVNDLPEIALVKTSNVAPKNPILVLHFSDKKRGIRCWFGNCHSTKCLLECYVYPCRVNVYRVACFHCLCHLNLFLYHVAVLLCCKFCRGCMWRVCCDAGVHQQSSEAGSLLSSRGHVSGSRYLLAEHLS